MSVKNFFGLFLLFILLISLLSVAFFVFLPREATSSEPVYVGISFCGNTTVEAKLLIDKVKDYTNLFVLQSGPISRNMTATTEICDYATEQGLSIIVYFGWFNPAYPWQYPWVQNAPQRYGDKFLGVYYYDEPGGIHLEYDWEGHFINMSKRINFDSNNTRYQGFLDYITGYLNGTIKDYDFEAQLYVNYMLNDRDMLLLKDSSTPTFVSDYALYWWDYLGGYDVVLAQLGWNNSAPQEVGLTRGAANLQGKDWGVIITWKYHDEPYLGSGAEIYEQMLFSYKAGAKYIVLFDYPSIEGNPFGVLTDDHFEALQKLWDDIYNPSIKPVAKVKAVLVLPQNYGWGMRHINDRIWLWDSDEYSEKIWNISRQLIDQYDINLDIVYDDPQFPVTGLYDKIYYWNQTLT